MIPAGEAATTDATGRFELLNLPPGDYFVETQPEIGVDEHVSQESPKTDEDREKTDLGYLRTYWPGADRPAPSGRISLVSGGKRDIGDLRITKRPSYRVHVTLDSTSCQDGEKAVLLLEQNTDLRVAQMFVTRARGQVPCNEEALIWGVQSGSYRLEAWVLERQQKDRERAAVNINVTDRNLSLHLPLERGADIAGKIVFPSNVPSVPGDVRLWVQPLGGAPIAGDLPPAVNIKGEFHLVNLNFEAHKVSLQGLERGFYVKDMLYNGSACSDRILRPDRNALTHSLEIIISDKPAAVTGRVADRDGAVSKPYVVLIEWPPNPESIHFSARKIEGDEDGSFRFDALAPGRYRLFSLRATAKMRLDEPNAIEQLVDKAQQVDLGESGVQNVRLEVLDF